MFLDVAKRCQTFGGKPSDEMGILDPFLADDINALADDLIRKEDWEMEKVRLDAMSMGGFSKSLEGGDSAPKYADEDVV